MNFSQNLTAISKPTRADYHKYDEIENYDPKFKRVEKYINFSVFIAEF